MEALKPMEQDDRQVELLVAILDRTNTMRMELERQTTILQRLYMVLEAIGQQGSMKQ